jgi:hypothetical protein
MPQPVVYATVSTWVSPTVFIHAGEIWVADDPVVKAHPECFTTDPTAYAKGTVERGEQPVEQATRAPGEKRVTRRT